MLRSPSSHTDAEGVMRRERPVWAVSAWGGFICLLMAVNSFIHGAVAASIPMLFGAAVLSAWAAWLAHRHH